MIAADSLQNDEGRGTAGISGSGIYAGYPKEKLEDNWI